MAKSGFSLNKGQTACPSSTTVERMSGNEGEAVGESVVAALVLREGRRVGNVGHQTECAENVVSYYGYSPSSLSGDIRQTHHFYMDPLIDPLYRGKHRILFPSLYGVFAPQRISRSRPSFMPFSCTMGTLQSLKKTGK